MQTWIFSPLVEKTYTINPTLTFWPTQTDGCNKSQLTLKVEGIGSRGFMKVELLLFSCDVGFVFIYCMCACIATVLRQNLNDHSHLENEVCGNK